MDKYALFVDRVDAGRKLAALFENYRGSDTVVIALPRGGVIVGAEIARALGCPIDVSISRKIGHPLNPEYAVGAISESGHIIGNRRELESIGEEWLRRKIEEQKSEIARRRQLYLKGKQPIDVEGKTVIIVDDGIATGSTMMATIKDVKYRKPKKTVVAVPVAPKEVAELVRKEVDDFVAVSVPEFFIGAIGAYYDDFEQVSDDEVIRALNS